MELDDFKKNLNKKLERREFDLGTEKIRQSLHQQTNSVLYQLKKGILFELITTIIAILVLFTLSFILNNKGLRIYFGTFGLIIIALIPVFFKFIQMINKQMHYTDMPVKENLNGLIAGIKLYMKRYQQLSLLLIPVCISYAFYLGYSIDSRRNSHSYIVNKIAGSHINEWSIILFIIIIIPAFALVIFFVNKWYLNIIYGRYLTDLEKIVAKLEE